MKEKIPQKAEYTLKKYMQLLHNEMGELVHGVYVYGSIASGEFNEDSSDIDFMTVLKQDLSEEALERLKNMHKRLLAIDPFSARLEGEYVCLADLRKGRMDRKYPYFADGRYQRHIKVRLIAFLHIKQYGITLYGKDFSSISDKISWEEIGKELCGRLNSYWVTKSKSRILSLFDPWVAVIVLTICRIHFTLEYHAAISKSSAGEKALEELPEQWHRLIKEALRIHNNSDEASLYSTKLHRYKEIKSYAEYMRDRCNEKYNFLPV